MAAIDLTNTDDDEDDVVVSGEVVRRRPPPAAAAAGGASSARAAAPAGAGGFLHPSQQQQAFGVPVVGGYDPRVAAAAAMMAAGGGGMLAFPLAGAPSSALAPPGSPAAGLPQQALGGPFISASRPSPYGAAAAAAAGRNSASEPIDVDALPDPPPPRAPPPPPPARPERTEQNTPHLVGMLETSALIMYPDTAFLRPVLAEGELWVPREGGKGEVVQHQGEEWARVRVKYKPLPPGSAPGTQETINLLPYGAPSSTTDPFGVVASSCAAVLGNLLSRGLVRAEGFLRRSRAPPSRMCAQLLLYVLTIPPNIKYVSDQLALGNLFLHAPRLAYDPAWFQNCVYLNPHVSHASAYDDYVRRGKQGAGFYTGPTQQDQAAQRALKLQQSQVDEVFESLKAGDKLDETSPGPYISTTLYPHQRKALSFLRDREAEKRPPSGLPKRGWPAPPPPESLWVPVEEPDAAITPAEKGKEREGRKARKGAGGWKNKVTDKVVRSKPKDCRGAILADDMGLGKSLTVVALVASTLVSARKYELKDLEPPPSPPSVRHDPADEAIEHFKGAVFNMPDLPDWAVKSSTAPKKSERDKATERAAEHAARRSRIKLRSRGTLIVCPLTTVGHWEDQFLEHWDGPVSVYSSSKSANLRQNHKAAVNTRRKRRARAKSEAEDASDGGSTDDDEDEKALRVYTYHGTHRSSDLEYLGDFDVVITTYSTLTAEYSKQTKTGEDGADAGGASAGPSTASTPAPPGDDGSDSDVQETDADGFPIAKSAASAKADSKAAAGKKRKRGKGAVSNLGMAKESEVTSPLQQVDWFRVVLDEAHFIKDSNTVASRACSYLEAQRRLAITGTPIQNKIDDIWALIKFIRLEPFDDRAVWQEFITGPAKSGSTIGIARLLVIMRHITLRRTKETRLASGKTLLELPERRDEVRYLDFTEKEREIYDRNFQDSAKDFNEMVSAQDADSKTAPGSGPLGGSNYVNILQKILRLRQICDHYLLVSDSAATAPDEDDASSEPLDYETASVAIATHGLTLKRAASVLAWMREEGMLECLECKDPLDDAVPTLPNAAEDEVAAAAPPAKKKAKSSKKSAVFTKCQHLYCLSCFKASVFPSYPKGIANVGRACSQCHTGLRLAVDCIELSGGIADGKASASKPAASRKSRKKRVPRTGEDLVTSSKINHLLDELLTFSRANRHSRNFAGDRSGMDGVSKDGFMQDADEDEDGDVDMLVMGSEGAAPQDVIKPEPGQDLVTDPPATLEDSSSILHGNPLTTKAEPVDDSPVASSSTDAQAAAVLDRTDNTDGKRTEEKKVEDAIPNDFSFDAPSSNQAVIIKDVHNQPPLGEPWASDLLSGKPVKSIVFSQWTTMLDRIEDAIVDSGIGYDRLDGSMKLEERVRAMDRLRSDPSCEVLLVSLRAGGVGLNLTSASRVYVMDPYWNPAVENQAVDRVHRLGQTRPVITVKYIMNDSMEERMLEVQARKTKVAGMALAQNLSRQELHEQRMEDLKILFS